ESPAVSAAVSQATGLTAPNATASVAEARQLQSPGVQAQVAGTVDLSTSGVQATVSGNTPLAAPNATAVVGTRREVAIAPQAQVAQVRDIPVPKLRAEVMAPAVQGGAPRDDARVRGSTDADATVLSPRPRGG